MEQNLFVLKRNEVIVDFDGQKIYNAIMKAMKYGSGIVKEEVATSITNEIVQELLNSKKQVFSIVADIEPMVFNKLCEKGETITARMYECYRAKRELQRQENSLDNDILGIVEGYNKDEIEENSNKNAYIVSTQRDLIAGIYSKDYCRRKKMPINITTAHDEGQIHFHDLDYFIQHSNNCFSSKTRFVTSHGVMSFSECSDGQEVEIIDKDGIWRKATVKKYGKQKMQIVTLKSGRTTKEIKCTSNHRWILKDGTITTKLEVGNQLYLLKDTINNEPINNDMFCLGFVLGDGTDYVSKEGEGVRIRLCNEKIKYVDNFIKAGYTLSSQKLQNGDIVLVKSGKAFKNNFIKNHMWNFMSKNDLISLFKGYYAADGFKDRNGIATANHDLAQMIRDISSLAGYFITSEKFEIRNTNFKENTELYTFRFMKSQPTNRNWKVEKIVQHDNHFYDAWCVEEPITHSFTLDNGIVTGNCCLVNLKDMLQNGTVINGRLIETPKSFQTTCTITTQIVQQIANEQYGGQTINLSHLAPYVRTSHDKIKEQKRQEWDKYNFKYTKEELESAVMVELKREIKAGVQTIQYQINTFSTTCGQAPFLSVFMYLNDDIEYIKETAMIIEEMLKQRIQGMKNEKGVYVTPSFPKLLYVLDDNNTYEDSEYFYLTKLATECVTKRMVPDFVSAKIMRQNYDGEVFGPMGCRSFLSPWKDPETGKYKWWGRMNMGVVTINLVDVGLSANKDKELFWSILDERLELCKQALMLRYENLKGTSTRACPVHFRYGAISRLDKNDTIDSILTNGYSTISLGYAGLYECVVSMLNESHTTENGEKFALEIMQFMKDKCEKWKEETSLGFGLYGTPLESTTYKFAQCLKNRFGIIPEVTDYDYITNSYHINVREKIDPFKKLKFESQFQSISSGGAISYVEMENMIGNEEAVLQVIQHIYENIQYAELNGKFDYCHECGHTEMKIDENNEWYCPNCGNRDHNKMNVTRRTCGYIGENFWNFGRTKEIKHRVVHLSNHVLE